jgi:hypothetical protein
MAFVEQGVIPLGYGKAHVSQRKKDAGFHLRRDAVKIRSGDAGDGKGRSIHADIFADY